MVNAQLLQWGQRSASVRQGLEMFSDLKGFFTADMHVYIIYIFFLFILFSFKEYNVCEVREILE